MEQFLEDLTLQAPEDEEKPVPPHSVLSIAMQKPAHKTEVNKRKQNYSTKKQRD